MPLLTRAGMREQKRSHMAKRRLERPGFLCEQSSPSTPTVRTSGQSPGTTSGPGSRNRAQRGSQRPTNLQMPECCHTHKEITISKPNPQRKLLQALGTVVVCARIEFVSSPGLPGHGLLECPPNNQVAAHKRAGGTRKKLHECDKQPSYLPCSKGRSVSVSALFHGTQLVHWL